MKSQPKNSRRALDLRPIAERRCWVRLLFLRGANRRQTYGSFRRHDASRWRMTGGLGLARRQFIAATTGGRIRDDGWTAPAGWATSGNRSNNMMRCARRRQPVFLSYSPDRVLYWLCCSPDLIFSPSHVPFFSLRISS